MEWGPKLESQQRRALAEASRRVREAGLVIAREGNLSLRLDGRRILVTPTNCDKGRVTPEDLIVVGLDGAPMAGRGRPSSELGLHLAIYQQRPDAGAVVHAHPPTATGFACAGLGLERPLLAEVSMDLGPVPLAAYATTGTPAMAEAVRGFISKHNAVLLSNHGAVVCAASIEQAVDRMETLEQLARISLTARLLGGEKLLPPDEPARLRARALG